MPTVTNARDCEHGQLARSCEFCYLLGQRDELVTRANRAESALRTLRNAVRRYLTDEDKDPARLASLVATVNGEPWPA